MLLAVGGGHRLHVEQYGRRDGLPAVVLHGGPGSGSSAAMTSPFDLRRWRVVLFDQRGAGRSTPRGGIAHNRTADLLADVERVRGALGIERWLVAGGSWGATLAVLYAARCRGAVLGLLLRGLFLARRADLDWFFGGAAALRPEAWQRFAAVAPAATRDLRQWLASQHRGWPRLADAWRRWEAALAGAADPPPLDAAGSRALAAKYRLQAQYIARGFDLRPNAVLRAMRRLDGLPTLLLHGRADLVCRPECSWLARQAQPHARLQWIDGVGHDPYARPMLAACRSALRTFARHGDFRSLGR
jgi:proline iminopeptidase